MSANPEIIKKVWNVLKQVIEIVIAAICGGLVSFSANAAGLYSNITAALM